MIIGFIALLACQLAGEFAVRLLDVPVPGPVVGLVLLFVILQIARPGADAGVVRVSDVLIRYLQLLFVPAGVGVVQYLPAIAAAAVPIVAGLLLSWLAALLVTASAATATFAILAGVRRRVA